MNAALAELLRRAESDDRLRAALGAAATESDLVSIAGEWGIALDLGDLVPSVDLSDAELESVSGGTNAAWYWQTADEFCSTNGRLCTFYAPYCGT